MQAVAHTLRGREHEEDCPPYQRSSARSRKDSLLFAIVVAAGCVLFSVKQIPVAAFALVMTALIFAAIILGIRWQVSAMRSLRDSRKNRGRSATA